MGFNTTKRKLNNILTRSLIVKYLYNFVDSKNNFKPKEKSTPTSSNRCGYDWLGGSIAEARKTYVGVHGGGSLNSYTQQFYFLLNNEENTILSEFNYIYICSPEGLGGIRRD